jgi:hypothetical protein
MYELIFETPILGTLVSIGLLILWIVMIVKFFQIAADIRTTRKLFFKLYHKNENKNFSHRANFNDKEKIVSNVISGNESDSAGDVNDPEVLSSLMNLLNQKQN